MNTILFFQPRHYGSWRLLLTGLQRFARTHNQLVHVLSRPENDRDFSHILKRWNPQGCVIDCSAEDTPPHDRTFGEIPCIFLNRASKLGRTRFPVFRLESDAVAQMAADALLTLHLQSHAFVPFYPETQWSVERGNAFRKIMLATGHDVRFFNGANLADWLKSLPKPCGIFAANDPTAQRVVIAADEANVKIPSEIAVIGVDNDEIYCEGITPGITSIATDMDAAGYRLGEILFTYSQHPETMTDKVLFYKPSRIIIRGTTRQLEHYTPKIAEAIEFIRLHACTAKISVDDVAMQMKCSRRKATARFRHATGHTIMDEIQEIRFRKMCEMLEHGDTKIQAIINFCGYDSESFAKRMFRTRTGMSMREWRKQHTV